jgi:hypothetical protein
MNDITVYRQKQAFRHYLSTKYSKLLEFNKKTRSEWILTNFARKKILFNVCNMSESEINEIEGIYRFRCYIIEFDEIELFELNEFFNTQMESIHFEPDEEIKNILLKSLMDERIVQMHNLGKSKKSLRIPIMLDLRLYGQNPDIPFYFGDKVYELDGFTKANIARSFGLVNPTSVTGERYKQMLNESKIIRDSYFNELHPTIPMVPTVPTVERVLQKARI